MSVHSKDKGHQAFRILQFLFIVAPIATGMDKFFNLLTNWSSYLSPAFSQLAQQNDHVLMMVVGVVEVIVGLGMIFKPKLFSYIIFVWLLLILINLILTGRFYDIALRDFGLCLAALATGRLSEQYSKK